MLQTESCLDRAVKVIATNTLSYKTFCHEIRGLTPVHSGSTLKSLTFASNHCVVVSV